MPGTKTGQRVGDPVGSSTLRVTNLRALPCYDEPGSIDLAWDSVLVEHGLAVWHHVYRDGVKLGQTRGLSMRVPVLPGERHQFEVIDVGPKNGDPGYDIGWACAPAAGNKVLLEWDAAAGAASYAIYWDAGTGTVDYVTPYVLRDDDGSARLAYLTPQLPNGSYKFVVRARDAAGNESANTTALVAAVAALPGSVCGLARSINRSFLSAGVDAAAVTLEVLDAAGFPAADEILIGTEEIAYAARTATSFTGCTRGANGSTPAAHLAGAAVEENNAGAPADRTLTLNWTDPPGLVAGDKVRIYRGTAALAGEWDADLGEWPAVDYATLVAAVDAGVETWTSGALTGPAAFVYAARVYSDALDIEEPNTEVLARLELDASEAETTARPPRAAWARAEAAPGGTVRVRAFFDRLDLAAAPTGARVWRHTDQAELLLGNGTVETADLTETPEGWLLDWTSPALADATEYFFLVRAGAGEGGNPPWSPFDAAAGDDEVALVSATTDATAPAAPGNQAAAVTRGGGG